MSDDVRVELHQKEEKSLIQRAKDRLLSRKKETRPKPSDRFSELGYLRYPQTEQMEVRVEQLTIILEDVTKSLTRMATLKDKALFKEQASNIAKLFEAFMIIASPWMRGLDNRELAQKVTDFFEVESMVGHLSAFYPDIKLCVLTLLHLAWQAIDVITQPPIMLETRTTVQQSGKGMQTRTDDIGIMSMQRELQRMKEELEQLRKVKTE